jgi:thiamine pyrophosphate-dependent acetolactate synthase large subunit-like protein
MILDEAVRALTGLLTDELVVHANGLISRYAFAAAADRPQHFYMLGSMGLASSIGLGVALSCPHRRVVVFDGDGNLLMNLGAVAVVGAYRPRNFLHVVFDNGAYGSTGNQETVARRVSLAEFARAAGYRAVAAARDPETLLARAREFLAAEGPLFLHALIEVEPGEVRVGRVSLEPCEIARRFRAATLGAEPPRGDRRAEDR